MNDQAPQGPFAAGIESYIILAIVIAGALGVAIVAFSVFGITVPAWLVTIGWILLAVLVSIAAVRLVFRIGR